MVCAVISRKREQGSALQLWPETAKTLPTGEGGFKTCLSGTFWNILSHSGTAAVPYHSLVRGGCHLAFMLSNLALSEKDCQEVSRWSLGLLSSSPAIEGSDVLTLSGASCSRAPLQPNAA